MPFIERILSKRLGKDVSPGDMVFVPVDLVYAHDGTAPLVIEVVVNELKLEKRLARNRAFFFIDHASPAPTLAAATVHKKMREFASRFGLGLFDAGEGISHQLVIENGLAGPGDIVVGADSHTPTVGVTGALALGLGSTDVAVALSYGYTWLSVPETVKVVLRGSLKHMVMGKDVALWLLGLKDVEKFHGRVIEYAGDLRAIGLDGLATLTNMSTEMMAVTSVIPPEALREQTTGSSTSSGYVDEVSVQLGEVEPMVARPPDVFNVAPVSSVEGVEVDQVFIGSCTNGRLQDMEVAARIARGRRVKSGVRCIVAPASRKVLLESLERGYIDVLLKAGCILSPPTCGPCVGAHMGLLAEGEVAVSTTNRNFPGRMGHRKSEVYLASPATAMASALTGRITDPRVFA
ncbi:3-isopropylmalate dehydratase/homoaconitate hydratase family large subunit [Thermogladius sp.]|uniref:3-isopropylmalate dehydratase/homoaconitate hydratase family large subunit n=1 Tax=Thermogladius sp. TaxID=2023064 RepID=UPI003D108A45